MLPNGGVCYELSVRTGEQVNGTPVLGPELRRLRVAQGLSQRVLARKLGYSAHSAVADYETGRRVPANDVLIGYEQLFGLPAGSLQQQRAAVLSDRADQEFRARTNGPATPAKPPRRLRLPRRVSRWQSFAAGTVVGALAMMGGSWAATGQPIPALDPTWAESNQHVTDQAERAGVPENMDGDDPRARDCVFDAVDRDQVPLLLPGGRRFGMLRLRHSAKCGASWGSALYDNPRLYTVEIIATRPADGAEASSSWSNNTPPGSYGDLLSTARGCVQVSVYVITPAGRGPVTTTRCLR